MVLLFFSELQYYLTKEVSNGGPGPSRCPSRRRRRPLAGFLSPPAGRPAALLPREPLGAQGGPWSPVTCLAQEDISESLLAVSAPYHRQRKDKSTSVGTPPAPQILAFPSYYLFKKCYKR